MLERTILHGPRGLIYRGKTSEISQARKLTFLNLRHNSEHGDAVISGTGRPQENRIFRFLSIYNKITFYPNRKKISRCSLHEIYTYQVIETQYTLWCSGKGQHVMYFQADFTCCQTITVYDACCWPFWS